MERKPYCFWQTVSQEKKICKNKIESNWDSGNYTWMQDRITRMWKTIKYLKFCRRRSPRVLLCHSYISATFHIWRRCTEPAVPKHTSRHLEHRTFCIRVSMQHKRTFQSQISAACNFLSRADFCHPVVELLCGPCPWSSQFFVLQWNNSGENWRLEKGQGYTFQAQRASVKIKCVFRQKWQICFGFQFFAC